jgi:cytoskeletal protein CcmA (bactofilin family)
MAPETSQSTESATAPDSQGDVSVGDVETAPKTLPRRDVTFSPTHAPTREESVSVSPRPLRLSSTKRSKQTSVVPSIICSGIVLSGTLESPGEVQFDGDMEGDICCAGLAVGEEALIQGEVMADEVTVRGHIRGRIRARKVHLFSGCCVEGEILYGALVVEAGAHPDCSFRHLEDPLVQELVPEETDAFTTPDALSCATTEADAATCGLDASQDRGAADALSQERPLSQTAA